MSYLIGINAAPLGAEYRGVELCNNAKITKDEFKIRNMYFREKVDELWRKYYFSIVESILTGFFKGIFLWLLLIPPIAVKRWIMQGK